MFFSSEKRVFEDFGIMIDCSRNGVPKVSTIKRFADIISSMGYNSLYLYTEDTYEVEGEPYFGYMRGRYTVEEIKVIEQYCEDRGVSLVPCIQTLAHLKQIRRYYEPVFDIDDILFVGEEKTYQLIDNIFSSLRKMFKSTKVNIGMDEAYMLGRGKYLDKHGFTERNKIFAAHLKKVVEIAAKYGFSCQMWSDMFMQEAFGASWQVTNCELKTKPDIPEGVTLINWSYIVQDVATSEAQLQNHLRLTRSVTFAGGAYKWQGFAPDNTYSMRAIKNQVAACKNKGIKSYLLTLWGDGGAEASLYSVLPSIFFTAVCAHGYTLDERAREVFYDITGVNFDEFMLLDKPDKPADKEYIYRNNRSFMLLYNDIFLGCFDSVVTNDSGKLFKNVASLLKGKGGEEFGYIFNNLSDLCSVLAVKAELGVKLREAYQKKDITALKGYAGELTELEQAVESFYQSLKERWLKENKPFGFEVQCIRLGALKQRIAYARETLGEYLEGNIPQIAELEEKMLPTGWFNWGYPIDQETNTWHYWADIATPGVV